MTPSLQLTAVSLRVPDLARSEEFYVGKLGFVVRERGGGALRLATAPDAPDLLVLESDPAGRVPPRDAAGLFHAALLFPSRPTLGGWLRFAASRGVEFDGFSDHGVSEALYFSDPDGNGLEFYADRPRHQWPFQNGELAMITRPLAVPQLLAQADSAQDAPLAGTRWGHLHLRVTALDRSEEFYRTALGVELTQSTYPGARFLAADGYHHHIGLNIWGHPRTPQPEHAFGLAAATFARTGETARRELRDPDHLALVVTPTPEPSATASGSPTPAGVNPERAS